MKYSLNKYYDTISLNYIDEIYKTIHNDIIIASEKNLPESFNQLLDFLVNKLTSKSFNQSIRAYSKSVSLFVYIYPKLSPQYKRVFLEKTFGPLISNIHFANSYEHIDNKYIELSYLPLINVFKIILEDDDYEAFNLAKDKFTKTLFKIENKSNNNLFFNFNIVLLSWIYFLSDKKSISYEKYELNYFEKNLQNLSHSNNFNFFNHFFDLFDEIEKNGLWVVSDWELSEPPTNEFYSALTPHNWLPYSLTIILMKYDNLINFKTNFGEIKLNDKFKFISDDIKKTLDSITEESFISKKVLANNYTKITNDYLNFKKEKILNLFSYLKKEIEIDYYKKIKGIPLSEEKINEFRNNDSNL